MGLKTLARDAGFEIRITLLSSSVTLNYGADPVVIRSRVFAFNHVTTKYYGNFLSTSSVGQAIYCDDDCEIRQVAVDGSLVTGGGMYTVQVEILPILAPCTGCSLTCDSTFNTGCQASTDSNCATVVRLPVTADVSMTCTAGGGADKIRVLLSDHAGIVCTTPNCNEQFILNGNYMLGVQYSGANFFDKMLLTGTSTTVNLNVDDFSGTRFTLQLMAVKDDFPVSV